MGLMYNPSHMLATGLQGEASMKLQRDLADIARKRRDSVKQQADKPGHPLPDPLPDTPENVMRRLPGTPPRHRDEWDCVQRSGRGRKPD